MRSTRAPFVAALALALAACDGSISSPTTERLTQVAFGYSSACAIDQEGRVLCWGANDGGQLGDGGAGPHAAPAPIDSRDRFTQVTVGWEHACALRTDGAVLCWGSNANGTLGVGDATLDCQLLQDNGWTQDFGNGCSARPVPVASALRFVQLAASNEYTCARTGGGELWCWGTGPLGDSEVTQSDVPIRVKSTVPFRDFALGEGHACAIDRDGLGWCWGSDYSGELGVGFPCTTTCYSAVPLQINSTADLRDIALGSDHTCALTSTGAALCWGRNDHGQLGDSTTTWRLDPTFAAGGKRFAAIVAGPQRTCALEAGTVHAWCWGANAGGSLGTGAVADEPAPVEVLGGLTFSRLALDPAYYYPAPPIGTNCGLSGGELWCWGLLPQAVTFGG